MAKAIPYGKQSIDTIDIGEVVGVLKSDFITQGPKIGEFEKALANYTGAKNAVAVSSGTAALHLACLAAGFGPGDEVVVPTLSFVATANCVIYSGAKPILVDVYDDTLTINVEEAQRKIGPETKAIIAVDFAGHPANWDRLGALAKKFNLVLIDDAAHALGSKYKGRRVGTIADMTAFSFHPVKAITTGEGGAITTDNRDYYQKLLSFRNHGMVKTESLFKEKGAWFYDIATLGFNYRMTDIQAVLGVSQLKKIGRFIKRRREIWEKYNSEFANIEGLILPVELDDNFSAWHLYTLRVNKKILGKSRREIFDALRSKGIGVQVHYIPIHLHSFYQKSFGYKKGNFPVAEAVYESEISLPLFPAMDEEDIDFVVRTVKNVIS